MSDTLERENVELDFDAIKQQKKTSDLTDLTTEQIEDIKQDLAEDFKIEYLSEVDEYPYKTAIHLFDSQIVRLHYKVISVGERLALQGDLVTFQKLVDVTNSLRKEQEDISVEEVIADQEEDNAIRLNHIKFCVKEFQDVDLKDIQKIHPDEQKKIYDLCSGVIHPHSFRSKIIQGNPS